MVLPRPVDHDNGALLFGHTALLARNFGFLHPNCKRLIALLHLMLKFVPPAVDWFKQRAPILCACCGAVMVIVKTQLRSVLRGAVAAPIVTHGAAAV